ncbi:MAG: class I SAM-dependent methyltransferase, partial [Planctomycetota bacterium]|nr:class I SAM-dependent methyltransferase [Planctomycetota bacterium]
MSHEIEAIEKMSYPDFVAYLGQVNTPPGAKSTLQYWIQNAGIGEKSHLFDLACTTGFSSRTIVTERGGRALGIDISKPAIDVANRTAASVGLAERLTYVHGDACAIPAADGAFTHILGGCNFA